MKTGLCILYLSAVAFCLPTISSVTGAVAKNSTVTIHGAGFSLKGTAKPLLWADFSSNINPSNLGTISAWNDNQSMGWNATEGDDSTGCAKATNSSATWTLLINANGFAWNDYGRKMYLFRKTKENFAMPGNWKIWRMWGTGYTYPNIYLSASNGAMATEGCYPDYCYSNMYKDAPLSATWQTEEFVLQSNSNDSLSDAYLSYRINNDEKGVTGHDFGWYISKVSLRCPAFNAPMVMNFVVHGVIANETVASDARYWADDVYCDTSWARVMIGNASSFTSCTHIEIQIPQSWTDTTISVTINPGTFKNSNDAFLYVFDKNGTVNTTGFPITIGQTTGTRPLGMVRKETADALGMRMYDMRGRRVALAHSLSNRRSASLSTEINLLIISEGGKQIARTANSIR